MNRFAYERANDIEHALQLATIPGAAYLGGGTNLLDLMKLGVTRPKLLVDLNHAQLSAINVSSDGALRLGALATMAQVARHPAVREHFPFKASTHSRSDSQIRNAATLGGNLLQRPRCFYFRERGFNCNKRLPGSGCEALIGPNEMHAIFGGGETCIAVHPSDLATALVCLGAVLEIRTVQGETRLPLENFFVQAERDPTRETTLGRGDLITSIEVPAEPRDQAVSYFKVPPAGGFAVVSAAVALDIQNNTVVSASIVMGGVAHSPWRAHWAEQRVLQRPAVERTWREAAAAQMAIAQGHGDNDYKIALGREVLVNALAQAAGASRA